MRSVLTRCVRIEERTLSIGFGIKRAPQGAERRPEFTALAQAFGRREGVPLRPLGTYEIFRADVHRDSLAVSRHDSHNGLGGGNNPPEDADDFAASLRFVGKTPKTATSSPHSKDEGRPLRAALGRNCVG